MARRWLCTRRDQESVPPRGRTVCFREKALASRLEVVEQLLERRCLAQQPAGYLAHLVDLLLGKLQPGLDPLEILALSGILQVLEGHLGEIGVPPGRSCLPRPERVVYLLHPVQRDP